MVATSENERLTILIRSDFDLTLILVALMRKSVMIPYIVYQGNPSLIETIMATVCGALGFKHESEAKLKIKPVLHCEHVTLLRQETQLTIHESHKLVALLGKVPLLHLMHRDPTAMEVESHVQEPFTKI
jgi:hypothetical protein